MSQRRKVTVDGNEAAASVAHRTERGDRHLSRSRRPRRWESCRDEWSAHGEATSGASFPDVDRDAVGRRRGRRRPRRPPGGGPDHDLHRSQGLLLMIPNMYKIAGELTPFCMHVAARTLATHALSIFGDHSDVMACRQIGFALLASGSVQEAHDLAAIAHAATLARPGPVPALLRRLPHLPRGGEDRGALRRRPARLIPDEPWFRPTASARSPPTGRCSGAPPRTRTPSSRRARPPTASTWPARDIVQKTHGPLRARAPAATTVSSTTSAHPEAERVVVIMGSGAETAHETVDCTLLKQGEKVGVLKVRLFRPVLRGRTSSPPSPRPCGPSPCSTAPRSRARSASPSTSTWSTALREARRAGLATAPRDPLVIGGRYGLSSKEFTPRDGQGGLRRAVRASDRGTTSPWGSSTTSPTRPSPSTRSFDIEPADLVRAVFFGLGADGTVGANKNSIKIIGEETDNYAQGYFVYDSKKSGAITISHLRFGPRPIRSSYLVRKAELRGLPPVRVPRPLRRARLRGAGRARSC